jgi:hypothetical protein
MVSVTNNDASLAAIGGEMPRGEETTWPNDPRQSWRGWDSFLTFGVATQDEAAIAYALDLGVDPVKAPRGAESALMLGYLIYQQVIADEEANDVVEKARRIAKRLQDAISQRGALATGRGANDAK